MKTLILVDFQNEWINPESNYFVWNISWVIKKVNVLINFARKNKYRIIFTQHVEKDSEDSFVPWSNSSLIMWNINKKETDLILTKNKISPFYKTNLDKELEWTEEIIVCGILTNLCVRSLVQDSYDRDFSIIVIKNCCVAFNKKIQDFTFKDLKETREEVEFCNLKEFLDNNK